MILGSTLNMRSEIGITEGKWSVIFSLNHLDPFSRLYPQSKYYTKIDLPNIFDHDRTNYGKFNIHFAVLADWNALDENLKQILKNQ